MVLQRGKVSRPVLVLLTLFSLVILLPAGIFLVGVGAIDIAPASRDLPQAVSEYRALNLPWEAKDLEPNPPLGKSENAASLILDCEGPFLARSWEKDQGTIRKALLADDYKTLVSTLAPYDKTLDELQQITKFKGVDFHHDWDLGANLQFPEMQVFRAYAECFCYRARIAASKGDVVGATKNLGYALKFGDLCGQVPTLIGMLVQIATQNSVFRAYEQCAALFKDNPAALAALDKSLSDYRDTPDFVYALKGDMYMGISIMRNLDQYGGVLGIKRMAEGNSDDNPLPPINPSKLQRTGLPTGMWARAFLDRHLHYWAACYKALQSHKDDPIAYSNAMEDQLKEFQKHKNLSGILDDILLPVFSQAGIAVVREEASQETTEALIKALEIRAKTGKLPTAISQIPGQWIDPFDKKPLRLTFVGDSLRIYSVGQTLKDFRGLELSEMSQMKGHRQEDLDNNRNIIAAFPPVPASR